MGIDDVKYGVMFNCVFVIDLIFIPCFSINMEFFNCIHIFSFLSCMYYLHNSINGSHGVIIVK